MREGDWGFSKAVFILCLILIPLFLLSPLVLSGALTYVYWITLLVVGFLTGFKARSHLTALNSTLVAAAIVALLLCLVLPLLHNGLRLGKTTFVDTLLDTAVPTLGLFFGLFFRIVPGAIAALLFRYLWRRGLKELLGDKSLLKDFW